MNAILCIDDNNGMLFNGRRQSQDKILRGYVLNMISKNRLWMNSYTKKQFSDDDRIIVDENFLENIHDTDYCFIENTDIFPYLKNVQELILFKWNRAYPADTFFTINMDEWTLIETEEFTGSSHERITKEIYHR